MSREPFILVEQPLSGDFLRVDGPEADHLVRVLRARPGSRIIAFNGMGSGWRAEVVAIKGFTVECRILEPLAEEPASGLRLQVGVGIVKGQRMDWAVEKASETGADMRRGLFCVIFVVMCDLIDLHRCSFANLDRRDDTSTSSAQYTPQDCESSESRSSL